MLEAHMCHACKQVITDSYSELEGHKYVRLQLDCLHASAE